MTFFNFFFRLINWLCLGKFFQTFNVQNILTCFALKNLRDFQLESLQRAILFRHNICQDAYYIFMIHLWLITPSVSVSINVVQELINVYGTNQIRVKNIDRIQLEYYTSKKNFWIRLYQLIKDYRSTFNSPFHKFNIVLCCGECWNFIWGFITNR